MTYSNELVQSAGNRIAISFDMDEVEVTTPDAALEAIREALSRRITEMLRTNPEKLMSILYRIDVREDMVNTILNTAFPTEVPLLLANLIIERQLEKARTRELLRNSDTDQ